MSTKTLGVVNRGWGRQNSIPTIPTIPTVPNIPTIPTIPTPWGCSKLKPAPASCLLPPASCHLPPGSHHLPSAYWPLSTWPPTFCLLAAHLLPPTSFCLIPPSLLAAYLLPPATWRPPSASWRPQVPSVVGGILAIWQ